MEFQTYLSPEASQALLSLSLVFVAIVVLLALVIVAKKAADRQSSDWQKEHGCQGKKLEVDDEGVCLEDEYAASQLGPYVDRPEKECPPCYCKIHGTNCPDIFRRLRELVTDFRCAESFVGDTASTYDDGYESAYISAAERLEDLINELEGKPEEG